MKIVCVKDENFLGDGKGFSLKQYFSRPDSTSSNTWKILELSSSFLPVVPSHVLTSSFCLLPPHTLSSLPDSEQLYEVHHLQSCVEAPQHLLQHTTETSAMDPPKKQLVSYSSGVAKAALCCHKSLMCLNQLISVQKWRGNPLSSIIIGSITMTTK